VQERMRFMQSDGGKALRVECFICPPKLKIDKDRGRLMTLIFSVKLDANIANACDEKIRRAFEDVTFLEREIETVTLSSQVENTNIEFYELPEGKGGKKPLVVIGDATLFALYVERAKGENYLYFQLEISLVQFGSIGYAFQDRFGTVLFGEFRPSTRAIKFPSEPTPDPQQVLDGVVDAVGRMVSPLTSPEGGIASLTISAGDKSVTIDKEAAERIQEATQALDPLYDDAVLIVVEFGKASTALLQKRLRIGYGRAAGLIDRMEANGIIGPADGSKPRVVLARGTKEQ
jgi:hypothetical protein